MVRALVWQLLPTLIAIAIVGTCCVLAPVIDPSLRGPDPVSPFLTILLVLWCEWFFAFGIRAARIRRSTR